MVYRILRQGDPIGKKAATNLYAAILTDTGGTLRYGNTTPEALRAGARL